MRGRPRLEPAWRRFAATPYFDLAHGKAVANVYTQFHQGGKGIVRIRLLLRSTRVIPGCHQEVVLLRSRHQIANREHRHESMRD
jgi:hypothetical protein